MSVSTTADFGVAVDVGVNLGVAVGAGVNLGVAVGAGVNMGVAVGAGVNGYVAVGAGGNVGVGVAVSTGWAHAPDIPARSTKMISVEQSLINVNRKLPFLLASAPSLWLQPNSVLTNVVIDGVLPVVSGGIC